MVLWSWIDGLFDHVCTKRASTRGCNSVVVHFEPQEHAMTDGRAIRVDEVRMIFFVPRMKLENEIVTDVDATVDVIVIARRATSGLGAGSRAGRG